VGEEAATMRTRGVTLSAVVVAALLSLLSALALPWAWYGDIDVPLRRLPYWWLHLASLSALYAAVAWRVVVRPARRRTSTVLTLVAGAAAALSAILVALGYDDASTLFPGVVPMVVPRLGPGVFLAVLAVLVTFGAVAATGGRESAAERGVGSPVPDRAGPP